jgi:hypothetical protein
MIFGFDITCFRRSILQFLLTVTFLSVGGCASTPAPLSPESRMQLGRVGVLALSSTPSVEFHAFAKGWAAGAAKGGAVGMIEGLLNSLTEVIRNQPSGPYSGVATLISLVVLSTVNTTVYGVWGGLKAVPAKTARQIEQDLNTAIGDVNLANDLAEKICALSVSRPDLDRYAVIHVAPSGTTSALGDLSKQDIDTLVEVQVTEAGFRGGSGIQPLVSFYLNAHIRLLATDNGTEIYTRDFQYLGRERPFVEWFSDGFRELLSGFRQAVFNLADRIVDELFIMTSFPFDSGIWALPGQAEFGSCWFRPIYPELKYTSLWHSIRHNSPGIHIRYSEVDSLQPLLKWEAFPRPRDQRPANASLLSNIADVTYDLKIWEAIGDYPERLVYDISGLREPQYRPTFPLKPMTKYFWTFRARYTLAGQSQVTRWAFSNIPSNAPSDYPQRRPGGSCNLDAIPSTNYFRFVTP